MQIRQMLVQAREASRELALLDREVIDRVLIQVAERAEVRWSDLVEANRLDLERMDPANPLYDRLMLDRQRIEGIAADIRNVALLESPVGETICESVLSNGLEIEKVRVPFGVVGVIYEARPNVSFDVFSLCFKTCNAAVLKGGSDAEYSNRKIVEIIREVMAENGVPEGVVTLLPSDRSSAAEMMSAVGLVDVIIPRGSSSLINFVRDNSKVPVIETGAGICHTYFDMDGDAAKGADIVYNAKTRRVSVCNALDCLVIHRGRLADLPHICRPLARKNVIIYADESSFAALEGHYPAGLLERAGDRSFGTEFMDYKMAVKTVDSLAGAVEHVTRYTSMHSEAIITENPETARLYSRMVDAACVYINASTAFTDGAQFGMGAEIGISTQKLHARGPMGIVELTSYKYIVTGNGQVRE
ncbi:MAG: glutamate-5-semialdehyde dehydrogenase [Rikenellaceae bacterium]|nr:glutamate-5-semialdehyde dehydrogenase [Rikenellaceae bacterium]